MKKRFKIWWLFLILILAGVGYYLYQSGIIFPASKVLNYETDEIKRASVTSVVGSTGTVYSNQSADLVWQTSGIVEKILVQKGQLVHPKDVLAQLSVDSLPSSIQQAQDTLIQAQRSLDNLQKLDTSRATAENTLATTRKDLNDALEKRRLLNVPRTSAAVLESLQATYQLAESDLDKAKIRYNSVEGTEEENIGRAQTAASLAAAQRSRDIALIGLNWALGKPSELEIQTADAAVKLAEAKLKDAQTEYDRLKNGADPGDILTAQAQAAAAVMLINQRKIFAPFTGTITDISVKENDPVIIREVAMHLDDLSVMYISIPISEIDINQVKVGQKITADFGAIPNKEFTGTVKEIVHVGVISSGLANYSVRADLDEITPEIVPGLSASTSIIIDSAENVLVAPARSIRSGGGKKFVFLLENNSITQVEVKTGMQSGTSIEVQSDKLKEGDRIIANPPATMLASATPTKSN